MPKGIASIPGTSHFKFVFGSFELSEWSIPYLVTTMSLKEVANSLMLSSEAPGSESTQWKLEELFQRSIDWKRVTTQIVPYLENEQIPQFFNSLTIALVPSGTNTGAESFAESDDARWEPPLLDHQERFKDEGRVQHLGPITIGWWGANDGERGDFGEVRWNPDQVFAVAIDGQHRLAAIKEAVSHASGLNLRKWIDTRVSVVLLVFEESLGYKAPKNQSNSEDAKPISVMRRLFIDMNKNAHAVSRARQILLDDYEPHAACVRQLIGTSLTIDDSDLELNPPRLPLSLVDWTTEQAKFETGPFVTTVLGVDWIITKVLDSPVLRDLMNYGAIQKQIQSFEKRLRVTLPTITQRLNEDKKVEKSFTYQEADLALIAHAFSVVWAAPLTHILTKYSPYAALIEKRKTGGSLSLDFQNWYELYREVRTSSSKSGTSDVPRYQADHDNFISAVKNRPENPVALGTLKTMLQEAENEKLDLLAFQVVFQKALVEAFIEFSRFTRSQMSEFADQLGSEFTFDDLDFEEDFENLEYSEDDSAIGSKAEIDSGTAEQLADAQHLLFMAKRFIEALNRVAESCLFFQNEDGQFKIKSSVHRFWACTLLKAERELDHTQSAISRARDLILLSVLMVISDDLFEPGKVSDFSKFWERIDPDPSNSTDLPAVLRGARETAKRYCRETGTAGRILLSQGKDYSINAASELLRLRLQAVWQDTGI